MGTRANILLISPDNEVTQIYHHFDGYLYGVGEELRWFLLCSVGISSLYKDTAVYDAFIDIISSDDSYEKDDDFELSDDNRLHWDIEFLYVIKDTNLYCVNEWDLRNKFNTYSDLIDYVCKEDNKVPLDKKIPRDIYSLDELKKSRKF